MGAVGQGCLGLSELETGLCSRKELIEGNLGFSETDSPAGVLSLNGSSLPRKFSFDVEVPLPSDSPSALTVEVPLPSASLTALATNVQLPSASPSALAVEVPLPSASLTILAADVQLPSASPSALVVPSNSELSLP